MFVPRLTAPKRTTSAGRGPDGVRIGARTAVPGTYSALLSSGPTLDPGPRPPAETRFGHDFGTVRVDHDAAGAAAVPTPPRLPIGRDDDPLEREADRIAGEVMRKPKGEIRAGSGPVQVSRKCSACEEEERKLRRKQDGALHGGEAPAVVHEVLRSPGQELDRSTRAFFEPRIGYDLSRVRLHADTRAADSARAVGALAYTVGEHIVVAEGQQNNKTVLAHELAHVTQQSRGRPTLRRLPQACHDLAFAEETTWVFEAAVRDAVASRARSLGTVETELPIPCGSAAPLRGGPQHVVPGGCGQTDIAVLIGRQLNLIETKRATLDPANPGGDIAFAIGQMENYVTKAKSALPELQQNWRGRDHPRDQIRSVRAMPTNLLSLPSPQPIGGVDVSLAWCSDGVLSFKAIGGAQPSFICGTSDRGAIDRFINRAWKPLFEEVERLLNQAEKEIRAALERTKSSDILAQLGFDASDMPSWVVDAIADKVREEFLKAAREAVQRVMNGLRQRSREIVQNALTTALNALCAAAAAVTLAQLVDAALDRARRYIKDLLPGLASAAGVAAFAGFQLEMARRAAAERAEAEEALRRFREGPSIGEVFVGVVVAAIVVAFPEAAPLVIRAAT